MADAEADHRERNLIPLVLEQVLLKLILFFLFFLSQNNKSFYLVNPFFLSSEATLQVNGSSLYIRKKVALFVQRWIKPFGLFHNLQFAFTSLQKLSFKDNGEEIVCLFSIFEK